MTISVVWPRSRGFWDGALVESLFANRWRPSCAYEFRHFMSFAEADVEDDGVIVWLPARHCCDYYDTLNVEIARFKWVLLIAGGDEESVFETECIQHPNMKVWRQLPKPGLHDKADRFLINGYATDTEAEVAKHTELALRKPLDWSFMGQVTHMRREECVHNLRKMENGYLLETAGFTKGHDHAEYFRLMAASKIVPCPSGARMPDSFRVAEALEAGAIPLVDAKSPIGSYPRGYWEYVFGASHPLPVVSDWFTLPTLIPELLAGWPENSNRIQAWWMNYKRQLAYALRDDINTLRGVTPMPETISDKITVLMPTSAIPSHPDTYKIDQCIAGIRHHLPTAEIIIMCDGCRPSVEHRRTQYEEYKQRLVWKAQHDPAWKNIQVVIFDQGGENHPCQSGMVRSVLARGLVKTPLIFFAEHDAPMTTEPDKPIDWDRIVKVLEFGLANIVRFYYHEALIPEHSYLFHGSFRLNDQGPEFVRTTQYSGWPHVTRTEYMRELIAKYSPFRGKDTVLETCLYSPISDSTWPEFKVVIYADGKNISRFQHTNGRGEAEQRDAVDW